MADSAVKSATQLIGNLLVQEAKFLLTVSNKIKKLEEDLEWMQVFLRDAYERQHHDPMIRMWISRIRDFAYESEDITENYLLKVSSKSKRGLWSILKWFPYALRDAPALHKIGSDLDALTQKITDLTTRMTTYGVAMRHRENDYLASNARQKELKRIVSHIDEDVIGIESDIHKIVNQLGKKECKMVVIHGMGGSGKTTLARKIYQHNTIKKLFEAKSWVSLSQNFQTEKVLKKILRDLTPESDTEARKGVDKLRETELHSKVYNRLKEKPILVVLDDIWTAEDWKLLKNAFPLEGSSSKLLLTTRNEQILPLDSRIFMHVPQKLNEEQSWKLLENIVKHEDLQKYDELGKKMLEHCDGHPLAITVLGGILATKKSLEEWKTLERKISLDRHNHASEIYDQVYEVLGQSYYCLPNHLKSCFLYLGSFPEDYEIPVKKLYQLWIAEGIVETRRGLLEENAELCLSSLIQRSLVQVGKLGSKGKIKTCKLHDLTRNMCLKMMQEEIFFQIIDDKAFSDNPSWGETSLLVNKSFRRLTIFSEQNLQNFLITCASQANLRTLSIYQARLPISIYRSHLPSSIYEACHSLVIYRVRHRKKKIYRKWMKVVCNKLQLLRVLNLEGFQVEGRFLKEIGNLIHLRYLNLRGTPINHLPSSIANMRFLQTLDLRVEYELSIPNVLNELKMLRHLYFPERYKLSKRGKLRLYRLHQLLTIENIFLDTFYTQDLLELTKIKKLTARSSELKKKESLELILKSKSMTSKCLQHFSIQLRGEILNEEPTILSKFSNLRKLEFHSYPSVKLSHQMLPESLTSLNFSFGELQNDPMPILEQLPNLKVLSLEHCYKGCEMKCSARGFPQLVHLKFFWLSSLSRWVVESGAFEKLVKVEVWDCSLESFPDVLPLNIQIETNQQIKGVERYQQKPDSSDDNMSDIEE